MTKEEQHEILSQIENGFLSKELEPLKCFECGSIEMKDHIFSMDGGYVSEYERRCRDCGKFLGYWAYGNWQI